MKEAKKTINKKLRIPIEINAKLTLRCKYLKSKRKPIKLPHLILEYISSKRIELKDIRRWELDDPYYRLWTNIDMPIELHKKLTANAKKHGLSMEMYIINILNNKLP